MEWKDSVPVIEAILFVCGESADLKQLGATLELTEDELNYALALLEKNLEKRRSGIRLKRYGDHARLETCPEYASYIQRMLQPVQKQSLTQTAMETLAVIAYRQPVTKAEIEAIRGVKSDYSVQVLLSKGLIAEAGRKEALGRPILYATTDFFLEHFGISDLRELPKTENAGQDEIQELVP